MLLSTKTTYIRYLHQFYTKFYIERFSVLIPNTYVITYIDCVLLLQRVVNDLKCF